MDKIKRLLIISSDTNLRETLDFCFDGWGYEVFLLDSSAENISAIKKLAPDVVVVDIHSARQEDLKICALLKHDFVTTFIPIITLINKRHLRAHLLNLKHGVDDYLIKPPDPLDLRIRIEMALRRSQYSFYASPLTGLPGGRIIEEILTERFHRKEQFTLGYVDIDNFKYFNDVYGYLRGDKVIMQTAYMLYNTVQKFGSKDDFIGHIGGDDFIFITKPECCENVCLNFIKLFDQIVPFHYSHKDRERAYIVARDRTHKLKKVNLMSVSVAVVTRDDENKIVSIIEMNERIAEIKKYLKGIPCSKFMADRRSNGNDLTKRPHVFKRESYVSSYRPLGQLLIENHLLSSEQLDEALSLHWRRGIVLGEILKELGFVTEDQLSNVLHIQDRVA